MRNEIEEEMQRRTATLDEMKADLEAWTHLQKRFEFTGVPVTRTWEE